MNDCFDNTKFKLEIVSIQQESNSNISGHFNTTEKRKKERKKKNRKIDWRNFHKSGKRRNNIRARISKANSKIGAKYYEDQREKKDKWKNIRLNERQSEITDRKS